MKRVWGWIKAGWLWLFADVRTEMRREHASDDAEKGDGA